MHNIKEGTYTVYYTTGTRFSVCHGRFTEGAADYRFDHHVRFVPPLAYTVVTFTLNAVNGNEPATQIGPGDFPP